MESSDSAIKCCALCDNPLTGPPAGSCTKCGGGCAGLLCALCVTAHSAHVFKNHPLTKSRTSEDELLSSQGLESAQPTCIDHPGERVVCLCSSHGDTNVMCCSLCPLGSHRGHEMETLDNVATRNVRHLLEIATVTVAGIAAPTLLGLTAADIPSAVQSLPFIVAARKFAVAIQELLTVQLPGNAAKTAEQIQELRETAHALVTSTCDGLLATAGSVYAAKKRELEEALVICDKNLEEVQAASSSVLQVSAWRNSCIYSNWARMFT
jgi:hypothetical protein